MDKNIDKKLNHFSTDSLYISAFLLANNLHLVNIDKTSPKRARFIFLDTPKRKQLLTEYSFGQENSPHCMVDVRKFIQAVKTLKERLYQNG